MVVHFLVLLVGILSLPLLLPPPFFSLSLSLSLISLRALATLTSKCFTYLTRFERVLRVCLRLLFIKVFTRTMCCKCNVIILPMLSEATEWKATNLMPLNEWKFMVYALLSAQCSLPLPFSHIFIFSVFWFYCGLLLSSGDKSTSLCIYKHFVFNSKWETKK